jgi:hypothetical protein
VRQEDATNIYTLNVNAGDVFHSPENLKAVQLTSTGQDRNPQWQP